MLSLHFLACVAMIPSLVVAEKFYIGGCGFNFDNYVDEMAHTEQGVEQLKAFGSEPASVYLWNPSNPEKEITNMSVTLGLEDGLFSLSYIDSDSAEQMVTGSISFLRDPKTVIEIDSGSSDYEGIFSFDRNGVADLYPMYISHTDVILRGCRGVFLGRQESLYVLTNQDYSSLDPECAIEVVNDRVDWETTSTTMSE